MTSQPLIPSDAFAVYPDNRKLVSGEISFEAISRRKQLFAGLLVLGTGLAVLSAGLLFYSSVPTAWVAFIVVLVISMGRFTLARWRQAWHYHRLATGQFLQGEVVSARASWESPKERKAKSLWITVNYAFTTPAGQLIKNSASAERPDIWTQTREGALGLVPTVGDESLQELAPKPGTPIMVRFLNDKSYQIM